MSIVDKNVQAVSGSKKDVAVMEEVGNGFLRSVWRSVGMTIAFGIICCAAYPALVWVICQTALPFQANGSLVKKDGTPTTKDEEASGSSLMGQNFAAPFYFHPRPSAAGNGYDPTSTGGSNLGPLSDKWLNGATQTAATQPASQPATQTADATSTASASQAATAVATSQSSTQPAETLAFDGVRLRTIHYAVDNNIAFKLYYVKSDGTRTPAALTAFEDGQGNLNDVALVDAFPHAGDPSDKAPLIAADFAAEIPADAVMASASGIDPHISVTNAQMQKQRIADARHMTPDAVQKLIDANTDQPSLGVLGDTGVNVLKLNLALDIAAPMPAASAPASQAATAPTTAK